MIRESLCGRWLLTRRKLGAWGILGAIGMGGVIWCVRCSMETTSAEPVSGPHVTSVVLLHGLGRTSLSMRPLAARLEAGGYDVHNWDYPSTQETIETHGENLRRLLAELNADPDVEQIHVVTHSLGGIITRQALLKDRPLKLKRVVMLAPPNKGSASARFWAPLAGRVIKPLAGLSDDPDSAVNQMGVPRGVEVGIIAAAEDGKVDVDDTHLEGEVDHVVVPGYHTFIMDREDVASQVISFLKHGHFNHQANETSADSAVNPR